MQNTAPLFEVCYFISLLLKIITDEHRDVSKISSQSPMTALFAYLDTRETEHQQITLKTKEKLTTG